MKITHLDAKETGQALKRLMLEYRDFHWAVAWATVSPLSTELLKLQRKIKRLVIGIDFDHTSPELLRHLMPAKSVHVATGKANSTFHPKVYGFVSGDRAAVLIGSSNFTRGGTHANEEACLLLEGGANDPPIQSLMADVDAWWKEGVEITPEFLDAYERRCAATKEHRKALAKKLIVPKPKADAKHPTLLSLTWQEYVEEIKRHGTEHLKLRLQVLGKAATIFSESSSFADIEPIERKALAGYVGINERDSIPRIAHLDWGWFGSMKGAGFFKNRVADGVTGRANRYLSDAVDCIPPTGPVTEDDYNGFVQRFRKAFADSERQGRMASATRLLAIKRPDYFVCVDSQNRSELAADIGFAASKLSLDSYWELVIESVMTAKWWSARRPSGLDRRIWDGRMALLDVMYYTPRSVAGTA
ncbi:MAG: phospholipase D family protein [Burkholderiales bacterium]|nr:phospholipase D family protein [Burkholderiales bacterium]